MLLRRAVLVVAWLSLTRFLGAEDTVDYFERHIRPALAEHCYACHSATADDVRGRLRLDDPQAWREGGESGPAIQPGDPDASLLVKAIERASDVSPMPPETQLPAETIAHFRTWIAQGAVAPEGTSKLPSDTVSAPLHWAFQTPQRAPLSPAIDHSARTRFDALVHHQQREQGLGLVPEAPRRQQIRRLYYDLLGLVPTFEQTEAFVNDGRPNAYEQWVDRLLADPAFGERWARLWLDISRYADTKGYVFTEDRNYADAYRYRDWVIHSFNSDRPYDDMIHCVLAADRLAPDNANELAAMGFLTLGRRFLNNRHDIIDDRIDVVSRGLLGLTVSCARCHSHKYDPIPIEDYYSLYGVFDSSEEPGGAPSPLRMVDRETPVTPVVFLRGNPGRRGREVPRQFLGVLSRSERKPFDQGSGREELARSITASDNPLTSRVIVNRVWGRLLGRYLVDTPSDFGTRCAQPPLVTTLDELAISLIEHDWSLKWLVREIVVSSVYRQDSAGTTDSESLDPDNRWHSRGLRRRRDFEAMRDAMLQTSGWLDQRQLGGPSVPLDQPTQTPRRSVYAFIDRQNFPSLFRIFDVASPDTHAPKRYETTVPQQALFLMNSEFSWKNAERLGSRVAALQRTPAESVEWLFRQVLGRSASEQELARAYLFVVDETTAAPRANGYTELAQVLLLSNEFAFVD